VAIENDSYMISTVDGQRLNKPMTTCMTASRKGIQVDMLKFAALYRPAAVNPMMADPMTAPATLNVRKVRRTMRAKAILDRRSFVFGGFDGCTTGEAGVERGDLISESGYASRLFWCPDKR